MRLEATLEFGWPLSAEVETSPCAESSTVLMSSSYKTVFLSTVQCCFSLDSLESYLHNSGSARVGGFLMQTLGLSLCGSSEFLPLIYSCSGRSILCSLAPPATDCDFLLEFVAALQHLDWGGFPKAACKCRKNTNANTSIPATWYLEAKSWDVIAFRLFQEEELGNGYMR